MAPRLIRRLATAAVTGIAIASMLGTSLAIGGQTTLEPSDVVLVFDVSDSILESADGTNVEFADALDGIADRVEVVASDLAGGNATISFVVFARTAIPYPANCGGLALHEDPAAIAKFEACLRSIAGEYRAGKTAPVRKRIDTQATDHVAALNEAAKLLPDTSSRAAVIFFTDGEHDPPGTARDNEDVVAKVAPAYAGRTPLAILPVGLGTRAGDFASELTAIYQAYFRDMAPCAGRASFAWPEVTFASADAAGTAVALALQEVTCSFTVAPTPTPVATVLPTAEPTPAPTPSPTVVVPQIPGAPTQPRVQVLDSAAQLTVDPVPGGVDQYLYECTDTAGATTQAAGSSPTEVVTGLTNGLTYQCVAFAESSVGRSPASPASASFSPCSGLLDCNPWARWLIGGVVLAAILGGAYLVMQRYKRRSRVWISAQVDGGENRQLGWGPELGIRLEEDERGWFAAALPSEGAAVHVRYVGENSFSITAGTRVVRVHQGDTATVRDPAGSAHSLILRRYRDRPDPAKTSRLASEAPDASSVQERLSGDDEKAGPPEG